MAHRREKFATQVDSEVLSALRSLADREGRQLQVLVEEALKDFLDKRLNTKPRSKIMAEYLASHDKYASLYKKLAE